MERERMAEEEADAKFAKDHPKEWKAKKDKEEQEYQAIAKENQARDAEIEALSKKQEKEEKEIQASKMAAARRDTDKLKAEREAAQKQIDQIDQHYANETAANKAASDKKVAELQEESDRMWQEHNAAKPADTEPTP
jgi:translation initiation factor 4G